MKIPVALTINGQPYDAEVRADMTLLELIRDVFGLTGTKTNCLEAECGVCSVLIDGMAVNSCTMLAAQCRGRSVVTIEGLAKDGQLHPLQQAFVHYGAVQCGYCIPGMILNAKALLDENPTPDEAQIREALAGTLCRCTGYSKIIAAVAAVARGEFAPTAPEEA